MRGRILLAWWAGGETLTVDLTVPARSTARVVLDDSGATAAYGPGTHTITRALPRYTVDDALATRRRDDDGALDLLPTSDSGPRDFATLRCAPISHGQYGRPVLRVEGSRFATPVADVTSDRGFLYATIDQCHTDDVVDLVVEARRSDGTTERATRRVRPFGWNRVTLDLSASTSDAEIVEVSAGLLDVGDEGAMFHLGELAWAPGRPTW